MNKPTCRKFAAIAFVAAFLISVSTPSSYALFGWGGAKSSASEAVGAAIGQVSGNVQVQAQGAASWASAQAQQVVASGDQIKTGGDGKSVIAFTDGTVIEIGPNSTFVLEGQSARKVKVRLSVGFIKAWVKKASGRRYTVRTPTSVAAVRGTDFTTMVDSLGQTVWDLFQGALEITDNFGNSAQLQPGRRMKADKAKGLAKSEPIPPTVKMDPKPAVKAPEPKKAEAPKKAADEPAADEPAGDETFVEEPATTDDAPVENPSQNVETTTTSPSSPSCTSCM
ncbi:MAG: FecR family protein [Elusimicrobiota bacterium]